MRIYVIFFSIALFMSFGCQDDQMENNLSGDNSFNLEGVDYVTNKGFLVQYDDTDPTDGYNVGIFLATDGFGYSDADMEITGQGSAIDILFYTDSENELTSGTYLFRQTSLGQDEEPFTFEFGYVLRDVSLMPRAGDDFEVIGGFATISNNQNDNYEIEYELVISNNSTVSGNYEGNLRRIDF